MPYSTNLTDAEWEILSPLLNQILPQKKRTRPPNWTQREILNGIFYQLKNGCNWADATIRFTSLFNRILVLQAVARTRSALRIDETLAFSSTSAS
jgi:transposase